MDLQPIPEGTVAVVLSADRQQNASALERIAEQLGVVVIQLRPGQTLESMDEEAMRAAGWVRATP